MWSRFRLDDVQPGLDKRSQSRLGTAIYAAHITSLRTQMDAALSAIGIPLMPYTDPQTLTFIKAIHFTDLQARIR